MVMNYFLAFLLLGLTSSSPVQPEALFTWVDTPECGLSKYADAGTGQVVLDGAEIVGGVPARDHEFPYQVSMQWRGGHVCGGSIINEKWVLSAAHCTFGYPDLSEYGILVGAQYSSPTHVGNTRSDLYSIVRIVEHADYDDYELNDDIVLLELDTTLSFSTGPLSDNARPVCPPDVGLNPTGMMGTVSGWGKLCYGPQGACNAPPELRYANIRFVSMVRCKTDYPPSWLYPGMICADFEGRDSCQGDSGGPLVIKDATTGRFQLYGIVSWGEGCAGPKAGVYSEVAYYMSWIETHMNL